MAHAVLGRFTNLRQYMLGGSAIGGGATLGRWPNAAPYRRRAPCTTFMDPWADPFRCRLSAGTQSLIAFGRGEWFGVGLGQSVQKMLYLPEAHTDFRVCYLCRRIWLCRCRSSLLGLYTVMIMVESCSMGTAGQISACPKVLVWRPLCCSVLACSLSGQTFINLGVNAGLLPTKGLTLPFVSYGGSSLMSVLRHGGHDDAHFSHELQSPRQCLLPGGLAMSMNQPSTGDCRVIDYGRWHWRARVSGPGRGRASCAAPTQKFPGWGPRRGIESELVPRQWHRDCTHLEHRRYPWSRTGSPYLKAPVLLLLWKSLRSGAGRVG